MPWENGIIIVKKMLITIFLSIIILPILVKIIWVFCKTWKHGSFKREEKEIISRLDYIISKILVSPKELINTMPKQIPDQFKGEWAIYSCSMACKAISNIIKIYPKYKEKYIDYIPKIINIALSNEIREYDYRKWYEDPLKYSNGSHLSYYSHLAWMISEYKEIGGDNRFDNIYHSFCKIMNEKILESPILNLPTYPNESIYIPDMLVAIVALSNYSHQYNKYESTVRKWIEKARIEWIDTKTGLLASYLNEDGTIRSLTKGSYSSLNCYYLSLIDYEFASKQYKRFKKMFKQTFPFVGIKEYCDKTCMLGFDIDAGPIICNLSPSGTAFAIGSATMFKDKKFRKQLLRTAEIVGTTVTHNNKSNYLLANLFLVGEAITLAMRTSSICEEN